MKPTIDLYVGKKVIAITRGERPWDWGIKLEGDVEIRNKDRRDSFRPMGLVNYHLMAFSLSERDTTLHFTGPGATKITISFNPTQYAIFDPKYGSESFPQWPELLEEMGIPAIEGGDVTGPASEEWPEEERRLVEERDVRRATDAAEFLKDTEGES